MTSFDRPGLCFLSCLWEFPEQGGNLSYTVLRVISCSFYFECYKSFVVQYKNKNNSNNIIFGGVLVFIYRLRLCFVTIADMRSLRRLTNTVRSAVFVCEQQVSDWFVHLSRYELHLRPQIYRTKELNIYSSRLLLFCR